MLEDRVPTGEIVRVPESLAEDRPYFRAHELDAALAYYEAEGYVVMRGLLSAAACDRARAALDTQLRPSRTPILRQKNMRYERNHMSADGFLLNPIFNVQDLHTKRLGAFKHATLDIITSKAVADATKAVLGGRTKIIQSMFFEAPANTWAHQDSYYQDSSERIGNCVAGWFALEDIDAGAGRFYVCPGSHRKMQVLRNAGELNFASGHQRYQRAMVDAMKAGKFEYHAPFLAAGDVLFWCSTTVHGSLGASRPGVSRTSLTAHYLRESDEMLQFHTRIRPQQFMHYNGMSVGLLHDQDQWRNRLVRDLAFHLPGPYAMARKAAMKAMIFRSGKGAPDRVPAGLGDPARADHLDDSVAPGAA
jgi:phytanoyl-CoA hydroxylase